MNKLLIKSEQVSFSNQKLIIKLMKGKKKKYINKNIKKIQPDIQLIGEIKNLLKTGKWKL